MSTIETLTRHADLQLQTRLSTSKKSVERLGFIKDIFAANPDNKMALKLFGNKAAVLLEQQRQAQKGKGVIHPFSTFRWYWDILLISFISMHVILLPVSIAFLSDDISLHWLILNGISDFFFIADICLNFRTGIVDPNNQEEIILDRKIITRKYLRGWFFVDLLSSLPFDYAYFVASSSFAQQTLIKASRALRILKLAKLLSLLRLLRVSRLMRYITRFEELLNIAAGQLRILKLIGCMLLLSHWNGCVQFLVPYLQEFPENSWVVINLLEDKPPAEQYSWALFKAMSHMLCIGYGRYPPQALSELWITLCSMTIGATFYAVFIGIMSSLIMSIDSSGRLYNEKLSQVKEYMRYRKLPLRLRLKVEDYYEHRFHHKLFDEEVILNELSKALREEILKHNVSQLLHAVPFFSNGSREFLDDIVGKLKFEVYLNGEYICETGRKGDKMYFIQKGIVDVLTKDGELATSLGDGSHFGEICLLTEEARRVASVRAATICNLYSLSSPHFHEVLSEYPDMRIMLEEVAKERLSRIGLQPNLSEPLNYERIMSERRAFEHAKGKSSSAATKSDGPETKRQSLATKSQPQPQPQHRSIIPIKQDPSTSKETKTTRKSVVITMPTETENNLPGVKTQNPNKRGKRSSFLNKTLFKTFAPALAAFAQVQKPGPDICEEDDMEEDKELKDLDVVAMVTDF
ncbi:potassium/sodium hyperpolarization-activated cyclic nucleotide-gated channel 2-like [Montipora capricornis]|uniref:potassium/sodium hyperpolarization-activated cyclic nucleotide-gated channel 2-like n=1 Tax=Montipora capricornis TaxID=246305 RepID=UPI0035F11FB5